MGQFSSNVAWPRERKTDTQERLADQPPVKLDGPVDGDLTFDLIMHGTPLASLYTLLSSNAEVAIDYGPQGSASGAIKISNTGKVAKLDFDTTGSKAGMVKVRMSITGADVVTTY
jgi:hypothetical protein